MAHSVLQHCRSGFLAACCALIAACGQGDSGVEQNLSPDPADSTNAAPHISGEPPTAAKQGQPYVFRPVATDANNDPLTFSIANRPAWAEFSTSTGEISGTPTSGTFNDIQITVTDGQSEALLPPFNITVSEPGNSAPVIAGSPPTVAFAGETYTFTPDASDADQDALTFTVSHLPSWAAFDAGTGNLSGTPTAADVGTHGDIVIFASDGQAESQLGPFAITVTAAPVANSPPTILGTPPTIATVGQRYDFLPTASDPEGRTLTFDVHNRPSWTSFDTSTGRLSGVPADADAGFYGGITITVSDGDDESALAPFEITVAAPSGNSPPTISGTPSTTATTGQAYTFTPVANDPDGNALTFAIANRPAWLSFNTATGRLSGTPSAAGTFNNIAISVSDGRTSTSLAPFGIAVTAPAPTNRQPTISGTPPMSVTTGQAYTFTPAASDPDGNALIFSVSNSPAWLSFNTATGRLSGTPSAANVGTFSNIVISVSDGQASASLASFGIVVTAPTPINRPPTISGSPPSTVLVGVRYAFTPAASDPDGDALTFTVTSAPAWATFDSTTGAISGTPTAANVGRYDNIVVSVSDGAASASLSAFGIEVVGTATGSATVSWTLPTTNTNGTPLTNLAALKVYWGTVAGQYSNSATLTNPGLTSYVVTDLTPGTWFFAVKAANGAGAESTFSNVASKTIH